MLFQDAIATEVEPSVTLEAEFAAAFVANLIHEFFSCFVFQLVVNALALQLMKHRVGFGLFALHHQGFGQIEIGFGSAQSETIRDVVGFVGSFVFIGQSKAVGKRVFAEKRIASRIIFREQVVQFLRNTIVGWSSCERSVAVSGSQIVGTLCEKDFWVVACQEGLTRLKNSNRGEFSTWTLHHLAGGFFSIVPALHIEIHATQ